MDVTKVLLFAMGIWASHSAMAGEVRGCKHGLFLKQGADPDLKIQSKEVTDFAGDHLTEYGFTLGKSNDQTTQNQKNKKSNAQKSTAQKTVSKALQEGDHRVSFTVSCASLDCEQEPNFKVIIRSSAQEMRPVEQFTGEGAWLEYVYAKDRVLRLDCW